MAYKIDPEVLAGIAQQVVGLPLEHGELITRAIELMSAAYPELIEPTPGRWMGNIAGGILGKVNMLYASPREYVVLFGTPTGTQGFSGRYKRVEVHKFLMAGKIESYELESDDTMPITLQPGDHGILEKGHVRGFTIHPGSWHIEYGRGAVLTTLPFAVVETLFVSLELQSMRLAAGEFTRLIRRQMRRSRAH